MVTRRRLLEGCGGLAGALLVSSVAGRSAYATTTDATLGFRSGVELAGLVRDRHISSEELTRYFIGRIERFDPALNAIPVRNFEHAIEAAVIADTRLAKGRPVGPLHGLPMTIKESFDLAGLPTTWGAPRWSDNLASTDSAVAQAFQRAGAHFMGKTNVPLMLGDFQSYNDIHGTTNNPWDLERTPGGSSGGSAAALAAGLTGLDSGSDIGGSIRNPAHYCGVYGHKPTWGVVSGEGHAPPGSVGKPDLAVVGPMGRSVEDLQLAMQLVVGPVSLDAPGWKLELPPPRAQRLDQLRVALLPDHGAAPVSREMADRVAMVGDVLARLGADVSDTARPEHDIISDGQNTYSGLLMPLVDPEFKLDHQDWLGLNVLRTRYRMLWREFFEDWDLLIAPIMPTPAFHHDHSPQLERSIAVNGEPYPYMSQVFWAGIATLSYLPSTVFPTGLSSTGLPIGLQAIGPEYGDLTTMAFAGLIANEIGGFVPPPGYDDR